MAKESEKLVMRKVNKIATGIMIFFIVFGTVSYLVSGNIVESRMIRSEAVDFAGEGIELVELIIKANRMRYDDPGCWKTIGNEKTCDALVSPMMATLDGGVEEYAVFDDSFNFPPVLLYPEREDEFSDEAVLSNTINSFSMYETYYGPGRQILDIPDTSNFGKETHLYRRIRVKSQQVDLSGNGRLSEILNVVSEVKWVQNGKVKSFALTRIFTL